MKRIVVLLALFSVSALVFASLSNAHTTGFTVSAECNRSTGEYDLRWIVGPTSNLNLSPKINASNNTAIPVGASLDQMTEFKQSISGDSTSASSTITTKWSDNFTQTKTASIELPGDCVKPPNAKCPDGFTSAGMSNGVLLCTKETHTTNTVEKIVYQDKIVYVDKPVDKIVYRDKVVYKTKTVVKNHTKTVYKTKIVYRCKKPKPQCQPGLVLYKGHCAAPGSG
jgi:hypothetical protein